MSNTSDTRDHLARARRGYQHARYPGDLAADVLARLDAGEHHDAHDRLDAVDLGALQNVHSARIGPTAAARPASAWRPIFAIAAAVAVLASTVAVLVHTGRNVETHPQVAVNPTTPPVVVVEPRGVDVAGGEEKADFTIVPGYQSFAFSMPTSLTPASVDEYDRQARETTASVKKTAAVDGSSAVQ